MTIKELIKVLETFQATYGNLDVITSMCSDYCLVEEPALIEALPTHFGRDFIMRYHPSMPPEMQAQKIKFCYFDGN
jgi:hypothetical protein